MQSLKTAIERLASMGEVEQTPEARRVFLEFRDALTQGKVRSAEKIDGRWVVHGWVKQGILLGFRLGELTEMGDAGLSFVDKDTFPARRFAVADRVRVVPGGSSVRLGSYVAPSVICMPPMFINVGTGGKARPFERRGTDWGSARAGERCARNHRGRRAGGWKLRSLRGHAGAD